MTDRLEFRTPLAAFVEVNKGRRIAALAQALEISRTAVYLMLASDRELYVVTHPDGRLAYLEEIKRSYPASQAEPIEDVVAD